MHSIDAAQGQLRSHFTYLQRLACKPGMQPAQPCTKPAQNMLKVSPVGRAQVPSSSKLLCKDGAQMEGSACLFYVLYGSVDVGLGLQA